MLRSLMRTLVKLPYRWWLLGIAIGVLLLPKLLGLILMGGPNPDVDQGQAALESFVGTLAEVLSGILGFTISVVAIVVQLSADRFTPKVTELFVRERVNFLVILYLIGANLIAVWTTLSFSVISDPAALVSLNLVLGTGAFLILIPYFMFVFNFLQPASIIRKIEQQIRQAVSYAIREASNIETDIIPAHSQCLTAIDEIKGIALSAIRQRESLIMLDALDSLKAFAFFYSICKHKLPSSWYLLTQAIYRDPDFVSVDIVKLRQIETKRVWLEIKIFRQYQAIFSDSLNEMREACYVIGINTREIAERALRRNQLEIVDLAIQFFNTYLRAVINNRDIRTGYNILKQYRLVAEIAVQTRNDLVALEIAQHFRYYSLIAYKAGLLFLLETFAFDMGLLAQLCCRCRSDISTDVLDIFLKIDQDPESEQQETTLRGVRKSQVKLAIFYLQSNHDHLAYLIFKDMKDEPIARLQTIQEELQSTPADFWEFTDRGENFYYVEEELRPCIARFFEWFSHPPQLSNSP